MKTPQRLLQIGGTLNALFFLFHLRLGWSLHHANVAPPVRSLLEMMNAGGALYILFLAVASLGFTAALLESRLGRVVLMFAAALYLLRAVAETLVAPHLNPAIFAACLVIGLVYLAALLLAARAAPPTTVPVR